jgi:hypothetical protein
MDPLIGWLDYMLSRLAAGVAECASADSGEVSDAARIDRIARLEKIKAAAAALQAAESVRFAQSQAEAQLAADVHPSKIGRGIADQLGLACHVSGFAAARRLEMARALWFDLPQTYRLLSVGEISDYVASLVVTETRHLDASTRRTWMPRSPRPGSHRWGRGSCGVCPPPCLRGRSARLYAAGPDRTQTSPGQSASGAGHHEPPQRILAGRTRASHV